MRTKRILGWIAAVALVGCSGKTRLLQVDGLPATADAVDFGSISVGTKTQKALVVSDDGLASVQIDSVEVKSGKADFAAAADAVVVKGNRGQTSVQVTFHPEVEGDFGDELVIHTSSATTPELHVALKGHGGPAALQFVPPQLDFGGVEKGDQRTVEFDVVNPTDLPLKLGTDVAPGELELSAFTAAPNGTTHLSATFHSNVVGHRTLNVHATPCTTCTAVGLPGQAEALKSAIVMNPDPLTWDGVPVHHSATAQATLQNVSWRDVSVDGLTIDGTDFTVVSGPAGQVIKSGASAPVTLSYAPQYLGQTTRKLTVGYHAFAPRTGDGQLVGMGGGPQIAVTPTALQFDDTPVGGKARLYVYVQNAGQARALTVTGVSGDDAPFSATLPAVHSVDPGATAMAIAVDFAPMASGSFSGTLHIQSNDPVDPDVTVALAGSAHDAGPCTFALTPANLDFGNVPPGQGAVLGFRFADTGQGECAVKDIQLSGDSDSAFFMPGGQIVGGDLHPNDAFSAQVAFKSTGAGEYHGKLVMTVNDPNNPVATIPIVAHSAESCLAASPPFIDFGATRFDCSPHDASTIVQNTCADPTTITSVDLGPTTLPEFSLVTAPSENTTLAANQSAEITARYARSQLGQQYEALYVHAANEPYPLLVPLLAETLHEGEQVDRFLQGSASESDVLFVVSNTNTMGPYQQRLSAAVGGLISAAQSQNVDLHVGVTSTGLNAVSGGGCYGGASGGENGRLIPVDGSAPRIVTLNTTNATQVLQQSVEAGTCQSLEQGLESMRLALSPPLVDRADDPRTTTPNDGNGGFLREEARLAVVVLADEDDHSGYDTDVYAQFLKGLKGLDGANRAALYAIVPKSGACQTAGPAGSRFAAVAQATGGATYEVCDGDYSGFLDQLAQRGLGAQTTFPLSGVPDGSGVTVTVNGAAADGADWYLDTNQNAIVFNLGHVPQPGASIVAHYRSACP